MSDQILNAENRVTAGFTIKLPNPEGVQYANYEATIFVPLTIPADSDADDIEMLGHHAMGIAQRVCAEQLGIEYEAEVTDAGVERTKLALEKSLDAPVERVKDDRKPSGGGNRGGGQRRSSGGGSRGSGGGGGSKGKVVQLGNVSVKTTVSEDVPDWVNDQWLDMVDAGKIDESDNELWDNRKFSKDFGGNGNPRAPWFKTKEDDVPLDFGGNPVDPTR